MWSNESKSLTPTAAVTSIVENIEEAHSWFYALLVLATGLAKTAFVHNVVLTDVVLKAHDRKMIARRESFPPISDLLGHNGDAYRLYCMNSIIVDEERMPFMDIELQIFAETIVQTMCNACCFSIKVISEYRLNNLRYKFDVNRLQPSIKGPLDAWILSLHGQFVSNVQFFMESYNLGDVVPKLITFIDEFAGWYIRLNRDSTSLTFLDTSFYILYDLAHVLMPFTPFLSEHIYQEISPFLIEKPHSVVLNSPAIFTTDISAHSASIECAVDRLKTVLELGKSIRQRKQIPDDHPLSEIVIIHSSSEYLEGIMLLKPYILSQLNVQMLTTSADPKKYDLRLRAKPIYSRLSDKTKYKSFAQHLNKLSEKDIQQKVLTGNFCEAEGILLEDINIVYVQQENTVWNGFHARTDGNAIVLLNTCLHSPNNQSECLAKEIIEYVAEMKAMINVRGSFNIHIYYDVVAYCLGKMHIQAVRDAIVVHQNVINDKIETEFKFRQFQVFNSLNILIQDEFIVNGAKLKIYICKA